MPNIKIDGIECNSEDLSEDGKKTLLSLQFTESQLTKLDNEIKIYRLAYNVYIQSLKGELSSGSDKQPGHEN